MFPDNITKADITVFISGILINLFMVLVFWFRKNELQLYERILGVVIILFFIPLLWAALINYRNSAENWKFYLIIPILIFLFLELLFDYILVFNCRTTSYHYLYLFFYYAGLFGLIGCSFGVSKKLGYFVLLSYFINLAYTMYFLFGNKK